MGIIILNLEESSRSYKENEIWFSIPIYILEIGIIFRGYIYISFLLDPSHQKSYCTVELAQA